MRWDARCHTCVREAFEVEGLREATDAEMPSRDTGAR
ncbi:uncharacterized protein CMC5_052730 [Chondromyces crocatus]|uniref:Uncharacterized protein n=1 Tax=Chondromyces crocatus TaxID=52 RepID=A0A0K1EKC2_CHOCO|nr:uncharacterized protein CMC5_052730 [Chondromyces crocatus]